MVEKLDAETLYRRISRKQNEVEIKQNETSGELLTMDRVEFRKSLEVYACVGEILGMMELYDEFFGRKKVDYSQMIKQLREDISSNGKIIAEVLYAAREGTTEGLESLAENPN